MFEKKFSINSNAALRRLLNLVGSLAKAFTKFANGPAFFSNNLSMCAGLIVGANIVSEAVDRAAQVLRHQPRLREAAGHAATSLPSRCSRTPRRCGGLPRPLPARGARSELAKKIETVFSTS